MLSRLLQPLLSLTLLQKLKGSVISHENLDSISDLVVVKRQTRLQLERTGEVEAEAEPSPAEPSADGDLGDPVVEESVVVGCCCFWNSGVHLFL